jgi:hypothetical protein
MSARHSTLLVTFSLLLAACDGGGGIGGKNGGGGGGGSNIEYSGGATVECDPDADVFDDLIYLSAWFAPDVQGVTAYWNGGSPAIDLDYDPQYDLWFAAEWADDLNTDCDRVGSHGADFEAYVDGDVVWAASKTMRMF